MVKYYIIVNDQTLVRLEAISRLGDDKNRKETGKSYTKNTYVARKQRSSFTENVNISSDPDLVQSEPMFQHEHQSGINHIP